MIAQSPLRRISVSGFRAALAALMLVLAGVSLAEAQYGGRSVCVTSRGNCDAGYAPPGTGCGCNIPGFGPKRGEVRARYARPPVEYYEPRTRPRYEDDGYGYQPRRRAFGSICVTSRGNCSIGRPVPLPSGCVCDIPGFGRKRGAVQ